MSIGTGKVEVVIDHDFENVPYCPHGPCLLFERFKAKGSTRFFACSVYRNKRDCTVHIDGNGAKIKDTKPPVEDDSFLAENNTLYKSIKDVVGDRRCYCKTCSQLFEVADKQSHKGHEILVGIDDKLLRRPSRIFNPIMQSDKESQYWFNSTSVQFLAATLKSMKFDAVICIGTPRLFEFVNNKSKKSIKSYLLDFDERFSQFYTMNQFARYNMFVNYFFNTESQSKFVEFINKSKKLMIVCDPPFGGMISPLIESIKDITMLHKKNGSTVSSEVMIIHPYFMEKTVLKADPRLNMLDYMVEYENHPEYKPSKCKNGSPVRVFTTLSPAKVKLPPIGYRLCKKCDRYVYNKNQHCKLCNACSSKDGRTYIHCTPCKRCVKPTYLHCAKCNKCHKKMDICPTKGNCHICDQPGHKRDKCPKRKQIHDNSGLMNKKAKLQ